MLIDVEMTEVQLSLPPVKPKEMISAVKRDDGKWHVRINASSLSVIQECPRKAQYLLHEKWRPQSESPATVFGSAVHKALEIFYRGSLDERILPTLEQCESLVFGQTPQMDSDLIFRAIKGFLAKSEPLKGLPDTEARSQMNGVWILWHYFSAFINDPYVALIDEHGPFVEREFTVPLIDMEGYVIDLFGTIDFAVRHTGTGQILIGDHKTASSFGFGGSSYFDRDKPNHQYTGYMLGAKEIFGIETEEFMVNVVEVKKKGTTGRAKPPSFPRQMTRRTTEDFDELAEVLLWAAIQYTTWIETNSWPLGPVSSCNMYGACAFKQVCAAPKSLRENILNSKFNKGDISEVSRH